MIAGITYEPTKIPAQAWNVTNFKHNGLRRISTPIKRKFSLISNVVGVMPKNVGSPGSALGAVFSGLKEIEGGDSRFPLPFEEEVVIPGDMIGGGEVVETSNGQMMGDEGELLKMKRKKFQ